MSETKDNILKPSVRGGFSDRMKTKKFNTELQTESLDNRTRVQLYNILSHIGKEIINYAQKQYPYDSDSVLANFWRFVFEDVYSQPAEDSWIPSREYNKAWKIIEQTFLNDDYDDVLTVLEAVAQYCSSLQDNIISENYYGSDPFSERVNAFREINNVLEKEFVGYRFIKGKLAPITDPIEKQSIEETSTIQNDAVRDHIDKALILISDRKNPDYENSIKESISAVEAMCEVITGIRGGKATLGDMLKKIESSGVVIHGALKTAFKQLYGYTSDANGIRHAGDIGGPSSTFDEAKFMLVSCCAFLNYLQEVQKN